jgi:predicted histidine transporter YuiF (NhaC family)
MSEQTMLAQEVMGPLTGITITLIVGLVIALFFYFRSKERQMMIEKGLSPEQITELFKSKRNPYTWLKLGVIIVGSGLGIGLGVMAEQADWNDGFISLFIITFIGLGFVGAFFISRKFEKEDERAEIK